MGRTGSENALLPSHLPRAFNRYVAAKKAKDTPCSSTTECKAGLKCCTMCPADAACGPGTEFSPTCDDGPCESPNWLEFE
ncbi:unnamed protein product, partial [Mesorhabditis spiculigera]